MTQSRGRGAEELGLQLLATTGFDTNFSWASIPELAAAAVSDLTAPSGPSFDGFAIDPSVVVDLAALDALAPLEGYVLQDASLEWSDVVPFVRQVATIYDGHLVGVPISGQVSVMYYRKDILAATNIPVPNTWEELLAAATALNGTDFNGDNVTDYSICWQVNECLEAPVVLVQIAAPYLQSKGTSQGWMFDPGDMSLLLNSSAMEYAMELMRSLQALTHPGPLCELVHIPFLYGACVFTIKWSEQFKATEMLSPALRGRLGVAQLPGSTHVLDRPTGRLVPCTNATCPYAKPERDAATGQMVLVNRAPHFGFGGFAGSARKGTDPGYQQAVYRFFANMASKEASWEIVLDASSPVGPFRLSQIDPANIQRWVERGYDATDTAAFLAAWSAHLSSPNVALDIRILNSFKYRSILTTTATNVSLTSMPIAGIIAALAEQFEEVLAESGGRDAVRATYRAALGYSSASPPPPSFPPPPAPPPLALRHGNDDWPYAALAAVSVLTLPMLCCVICCIRRKGPRAPGPSPETTLLVASLPDLKALQRDLPEAVLEQALTQYLALMRRLLRFFRAHEAIPARSLATGAQADPSTKLLAADAASDSVTKPAAGKAAADAGAAGPVAESLMEARVGVGAVVTAATAALTPLTSAQQLQQGTLLIAFRNPRDALAFAAAAAEALLQLDWPAPLLAHPACAPLYALPVAALPGELPTALPTAVPHGEAAGDHTRPGMGVSATGYEPAAKSVGPGASAAGSSQSPGRAHGAAASGCVTWAPQLQERASEAGGEGRHRQVPRKESSYMARALLARQRVFELVRRSSSLHARSLSGTSEQPTHEAGPNRQAVTAVRSRQPEAPAPGSIAPAALPAATVPEPSVSAGLGPGAAAAGAHPSGAAHAADPVSEFPLSPFTAMTSPPITSEAMASPPPPAMAEGAPAVSSTVAGPSVVTLNVGKLTPAWLSEMADPLAATAAGGAASGTGSRPNSNVFGPVATPLGFVWPSAGSFSIAGRVTATAVTGSGGGGPDGTAASSRRGTSSGLATGGVGVISSARSRLFRHASRSLLGPLAASPSPLAPFSASRSSSRRQITSTTGLAAAWPGGNGGAACADGDAGAEDRSIERGLLPPPPAFGTGKDPCPPGWLPDDKLDLASTAAAVAATPPQQAPRSWSPQQGPLVTVKESSSAAMHPARADSDTSQRGVHISLPPTPPDATRAGAAARTHSALKAPTGDGGGGAPHGQLQSVRMGLYYRAAYKLVNVYGQIMSYVRGDGGGSDGTAPPGASGLGATAGLPSVKPVPLSADLMSPEGPVPVTQAKAIDDSVLFRSSTLEHTKAPVGCGAGEELQPVQGHPVLAVAAARASSSEAPSGLSGGGGAIGSVNRSFSITQSRRDWVAARWRLMWRAPEAAAPATAAWGAKGEREAVPGTVPDAQLATAMGELGVLVQRGLRVCMGLSSGIGPEHVTYNRVAKRTQYGGFTLGMAYALSHAACGTASRLLVSGWCFKHLGGGGAGDVTLLNIGEYDLVRPSDDLPYEGPYGMPLDLYMALPPRLGPSLAAHLPPRGSLQTQAGVLEAPVGDVTIVFVNVVGVSTLLAWDTAETQAALQLLHSVAARALAAHGGYLVEAVDGLLLAAFRSPGAAVRWGLALVSQLLTAEWRPKLLEHELCEEVNVVTSEARGAFSSGGESPSRHARVLQHLYSQRQHANSNNQQQLQPERLEGPEPERARHAPDPPSMLLRAISSRGGGEEERSSGGGDGSSSGVAVGGTAAQVSGRGVRNSSRPGTGDGGYVRAGSRLPGGGGPGDGGGGDRGGVGGRSQHGGVGDRSEHGGGGRSVHGGGGDRCLRGYDTSRHGAAKTGPRPGAEGGGDGAGDVRLLRSQSTARRRASLLLSCTSLGRGTAPVTRLLYRGLRLKIGVDAGPVRAQVSEVTGRATYRGRAMNRAARIAAKAAAGQVWCSADAWHAARDAQPLVAPRQPSIAGAVGTGGVPSPPLAPGHHGPPTTNASGDALPQLVGRYQGTHMLKGLNEPLDLWSCRFAEVAQERSSASPIISRPTAFARSLSKMSRAAPPDVAERDSGGGGGGGGAGGASGTGDVVSIVGAKDVDRISGLGGVARRRASWIPPQLPQDSQAPQSPSAGSASGIQAPGPRRASTGSQGALGAAAAAAPGVPPTTVEVLHAAATGSGVAAADTANAATCERNQSDDEDSSAQLQTGSGRLTGSGSGWISPVADARPVRSPVPPSAARLVGATGSGSGAASGTASASAVGSSGGAGGASPCASPARSVSRLRRSTGLSSSSFKIGPGHGSASVPAVGACGPATESSGAGF